MFGGGLLQSLGQTGLMAYGSGAWGGGAKATAGSAGIGRMGDFPSLPYA